MKTVQAIFVLSLCALLSACANTLHGATQDGIANLNRASAWANENRDTIDQTVSQTGELLKQGGHWLGKGMEKTGELLQEITR